MHGQTVECPRPRVVAIFNIRPPGFVRKALIDLILGSASILDRGGALPNGQDALHFGNVLGAVTWPPLSIAA